MPLELDIVTPRGVAYRGQVDSVTLPGSEGDFGVLPGHERFLCPLRMGELQIRSPQGAQWAAVSGGFADVSGAEVAVMVESCELAPDIDLARAERASARAERRLRGEDAGGVGEELDRQRAERALARARARISAGRPR